MDHAGRLEQLKHSMIECVSREGSKLSYQPLIPLAAAVWNNANLRAAKVAKSVVLGTGSIEQVSSLEDLWVIQPHATLTPCRNASIISLVISLIAQPSKKSTQNVENPVQEMELTMKETNTSRTQEVTH